MNLQRDQEIFLIISVSMPYTKIFFYYITQSIYLCVVNLSATPSAIIWSVGGAMACQSGLGATNAILG